MNKSPLEKIKIAAPCKAEWRWMYGNDRVRFCGQCNLNVYNLSAMTREEAEDLIRRTEGRLCVRFYRRSDGTILTGNCPVGLQALKDKFNRVRTYVIAVIFGFLSYLGFSEAYSLTSPNPNIGVIGHTQGMIAMPPRPIPPIVQRSESFVRDIAIFKVIPIDHSNNGIRLQGD